MLYDRLGQNNFIERKHHYYQIFQIDQKFSEKIYSIFCNQKTDLSLPATQFSKSKQIEVNICFLHLIPMCNRGTRRVPHVEQELLSLPRHLCTPPVLVWFMLLDLQFSIQWFADPCLSICHFSLSHCYLFFFDLRFCLYLNVDIFFFNQSQGAGVTRRVPHVEQELSGVRVGRSFVFCVMSCRPLFILLSILSDIVLSVLHLTAFDYHFSISKLFFHRRLYLVFY